MTEQLRHLLPYLAAFLAVVFAVYGIAGVLTPDARLRRLGPGGPGPGEVSVRRRASTFERIALGRFSERLVPSSERERTSLKQWLTQAGYSSPQSTQAYYGFRVLLGLGLPALTMLLLPVVAREKAGSYLMTAVLIAAVVGFMIPTLWVHFRRKARQDRIRRALPEILDLLLVCTEAGLGLDMAIAKVGDESMASQPTLASLLILLSTELRAGRPRQEAFRALAERSGVQELTSLVNLLVQSDTLGTSMGTTLRVFANDMRAYQLLNAEEMAQKVTAKMSMVLVAFLMPALVTAIIAPVLFHIVQIWKGMPL